MRREVREKAPRVRIKGIAIFLLSALVAVMFAPPFQTYASDKINFNPSVKQLPSNEEIFGWIKDLCNFGYRRPGTEADLKAAQYIMEKFKEFGLENVRLEPIDMPLWTAEKWSLTVNGQEIPCFYISHSYWTKEYEGFSAGPAGITAEMVYVGKGSEKDFRKVDVKGKIVLSDVSFFTWYWSDSKKVSYFTYDPDNTIPKNWSQHNPYVSDNFPNNLYRAAKHGAVGFVGILTDYVDRNTYYNEVYDEKPCLMQIPGLWLSKSDGARLKSLFKKGSTIKATLVLDGKIVPAVANNVIGFLKGKTDDIIMVHSHHDAPWSSAVEDASGVSEVLALAKYFGRIPAEKREKTLMFVTTDTHFSMYQAHLDLIKKINEKKMNVIVDICIEHIGKEIVEREGKIVETGFVEPRLMFVSENPYLLSFTKQAVVKNRLGRTLFMPTYSPLGVPTDAGDFNRAGIPIISYISPPIYIYDPIDTPDMVAVDQLNPIATAFADIIESLDPLPSEVVNKRSWIVKNRLHFYKGVLLYIGGRPSSAFQLLYYAFAG